MGFPKKEELDEILSQLENVEGSLALDPNASPLEKFRFGLCQKFLKYKIENGLTQKELAKKIGIDEAKMSKILHHRIKEFSTDRLINLYLQIDPNIDISISSVA